MSTPPRFRRIAPASAASLLLALAACNSQPQNLVSSGPVDDQAAALQNAAPVELPPAIAASKTYRCKDNSVVAVDWMTGDKVADVRVGKSPMVMVKADEAGKPLTADGGYSVTGSASAPTATIATPGHPAQSCKA